MDRACGSAAQELPTMTITILDSAHRQESDHYCSRSVSVIATLEPSPDPLGNGSTRRTGMVFTARRVATNTAGETVAILATRRLGATTLAEAKIEASRRQRAVKQLAQHVLEIVDESGAVLTGRQQNGKRVQSPWS